MIDFLAGLVLGAAFANFWIFVWTTLVKPQLDKVLNGKKP